ncbi:putative trehalose-phosphatase [Nosema granulosis]|uniref:Trehalose-phosphatase n=1 Tax=Nosema granulosis TaxID=83296 RepID=A0A9P6H1S0_9MICR|nr:putative trehalose-phosphatase [Nosema granulosis]
MKTFIVNTDLLYYASRYEEDVAFVKMLGDTYKTANNDTKASKIIVDFAKPTGKLHIYSKPRYMVKDYCEDPNTFYIGVFSTDESIQDSDYSHIEDFCEEKNIIPIFIKRPKMGTVIKEILEGNTYRHVYPKNQLELWNEYYTFNQRIADKIVLYCDMEDSIWIQDHHCFLVPQFIENKNIITSFNLPFTALIVSIPYFKQIMANLVKSRAVSFLNPCGKSTFRELICKYTIDTDESMPLATCHSFATDVDYIDKMICTEEFQDCDLFNGVDNLIILPYNSPDHLLAIEAYLNKYEETLNIVLLNLGDIDLEKQIEVQRIVEHLKSCKRVCISTILPRSDIELFRIISNCKIGMIPSLKGYFYYFNKHYLTENICDYEDVAIRIQSIIVCKKTKGLISKRFVDPGTAKKHLTTPKCIRDRMLSFAQPQTLIEDTHAEANSSREFIKENDLEARKGDYPIHLIVPCADKYYDIEDSVDCEFNTKASLDESEVENSTRLSADDSGMENKSREIQLTGVDKKQCESSVEHVDKLIQHIKNSGKTVFLLDYDGTLTPIVDNPDDATPSSQLIEILKKLNKKDNIKVYIVTGRSQKDMDNMIPQQIDVFAEHGAFQRKNGKWTQLSEVYNMNLPYKIAEFYHERTPKSKLEKKVNGFVFHYRNCDYDIGEKQAMSLMEQLKRVDFERTKGGKKIVEFRSCGKNKVLDFISGDLIIAAGDDQTDEDMFLSKDTISIKVGKEKSKAHYCVDNVNVMINVLNLISKEI